MSNLTDYLEEKDLARKMWGKYLLNELKYDKYGAQGKFMLLKEILNEEGFDVHEGIDYQELINEIFPRTFYCEHQRKINPSLAKTILKYFNKLESDFTQQDMPVNVVKYICVMETAEKFCLPADTVKMITNQKL